MANQTMARIDKDLNREIQWLRFIKRFDNFSDTVEFLVDYYKEKEGIKKSKEEK